ncbi:MAG: DNA-directed RNA polymerase subunit alpha [Patescibacteria group bacterium]
MIPLSKSPKVLEHKGTKGVFEVEALYPGYGYTIGNSLRRVLLSSLEGAAVTQVRIQGAPHEFSTIPGVLEDVLMILLNIKQMRFKLFSDEPQKATLKVRGEKEVKASDFVFPSQIELVNKDLPIAHLTSKSAELEMEIQVEKGVGYVPAEERKKEKEEVGIISLDAIFTPIQKVSSVVKNMRVGERTDFNHLTLEIETDGTITPQEALYRASSILGKQFQVVMEGLQEQTGKEEKREGKEKKRKTSKTKKSKK